MKCPRLKAVGLLPVVELPHLTQEVLLKKYYIGLDVHRDSVFMAVLDEREVRPNEKEDSDMIGTREVPANSPQPEKAIKSYQAKEQYLSHQEGLTEGIERMEIRIRETAEEPAYRETIQKLRAFRGIDWLTALALICETGDFRRFPGVGRLCSTRGWYRESIPAGETESGKEHHGGGHAYPETTGRISMALPPAGQSGQAAFGAGVGTSELVIARADEPPRYLKRCVGLNGRSFDRKFIIPSTHKRVLGYNTKFL
jgi:hypothetical protein